jgi:hypothetical protein
MDKPIAMFVNIPELNQYYKHFNGKFGPVAEIVLCLAEVAKGLPAFYGYRVSP